MKVHWDRGPLPRKTLCNLPRERLAVTQDKAAVTCSRCVRRLGSLSPRADFPDTPTFLVSVEEQTRRGNLVRSLSFTCPCCGLHVVHGGGEMASASSHRVSHCDCWENGYYLMEPAASLIAETPRS
jgi:hypothetical protein